MQIQFISRQRDFCPFDHGVRLDCDDKLVSSQSDRCAICTPLGRLITGTKGYLDIFVTVFVSHQPQWEAHADRSTVSGPYTNEDNRVHVGLLDTSVDVDKGRSVSYPIESIFPLSNCQFMGLRVPCPRVPQVILENTYGAGFIKPTTLCNVKRGKWIDSRWWVPSFI